MMENAVHKSIQSVESLWSEPMLLIEIVAKVNWISNSSILVKPFKNTHHVPQQLIITSNPNYRTPTLQTHYRWVNKWKDYRYQSNHKVLWNGKRENAPTGICEVNADNHFRITLAESLISFYASPSGVSLPRTLLPQLSFRYIYFSSSFNLCKQTDFPEGAVGSKR
jgi:hypothetical protein